MPEVGPEAATIDAVQAWMQAAILAGEPGGDSVRRHVRGDNRLSAEARVAIYARTYRLRLVECLRAEYPLLAALAGPTAFELFANGYIAVSPSRSFTLYDFGAGFAEYLERSRPAGDGTPQTVEAVPAALARIERARAEVTRARGLERFPPTPPPTGLDPAVAALLGLHREGPYRRPDSVRLLSLAFDFTALLAAAPEARLPLPDPARSLLAVARVRYRVAYHRLDASQYEWLASLPAMGDAAAAPPPGPSLAAWLPQAIAMGFVAAA